MGREETCGCGRLDRPYTPVLHTYFTAAASFSNHFPNLDAEPQQTHEKTRLVLCFSSASSKAVTSRAAWETCVFNVAAAKYLMKDV